MGAEPLNTEQFRSNVDHTSHRPSVRMAIVAGAWLLAVITAMLLLTAYSKSPGHAGSPPIHWPSESRIALETSRPTLVMFAHPRCPCTRASIGELALLMARCQGRVAAHVLFLKPQGTTEDWTKTDLWRHASVIPGVTVHGDDDGTEASRFHSETSGQTMLYDQNGRLLFQGGITISRGHAGDNPGRSALAALLEHKSSNQVMTADFGCSLLASGAGKGDVVCKK